MMPEGFSKVVLRKRGDRIVGALIDGHDVVGLRRIDWSMRDGSEADEITMVFMPGDVTVVDV